MLLMLSVCCFADEFEDEELFPEDALSNHTDMVDNEPVINEAKRKFIRSEKSSLVVAHLNHLQAYWPCLHSLPK